MQTFHDGSDFAPIAKAAPAAVTELLRGEDFVTAAEVENMQYDMPTEGYEDPLVRTQLKGAFSIWRGLTPFSPSDRSTNTYDLSPVLA